MDNFVKTDDILNDMCGIIESSQKAVYQAVNIALVQSVFWDCCHTGATSGR